MQDNEIIQQVKDGDKEAFSVIVEKYHRKLLNFIYNLMGSEDIVEEIGQEVFLNVYKSLNRFDEKRGTPFAAWLFIAARNRCISELRKEKRPLENIDNMAPRGRAALDILLDKERREAVEAAVIQLKEPYKSTILKSLAGDMISDIADKEMISIGTVKSRLYRARMKLKQLLKNYLEEV